MKICESIQEIREYVRDNKEKGHTIGLVPTMGYFHEGHLSLMRMARRECDVVVISLFVNPTQFGPGEDFEDYPRDFDRDAKLAEEVGVDAIFVPTAGEMYPEDYCTYVEVEDITAPLCGRSRPGHFRGVATVVTKLFNIVEPNRAYFGQKDAQQLMVIKQMTRDLNMDIEIIACPIIREEDGLATSSRNVYLTPEQREAAVILYKALTEAEDLIARGEKDAEKLQRVVMERIQSEPLASIDYVEVLSAPRLKPLKTLQGRVLIAVAVWFGKTRLIDNTIVEV